MPGFLEFCLRCRADFPEMFTAAPALFDRFCIGQPPENLSLGFGNFEALAGFAFAPVVLGQGVADFI